jgi:hypothetical protein
MRLVLTFALLFSLTATTSAEAIRHSFFIAGPTFTGIIAEDDSND